jgi:hypothetical protein
MAKPSAFDRIGEVDPVADSDRADGAGFDGTVGAS